MLLALLIIGFGASISIRAWIAGVAMAKDRVRVRGVLYSRTIPRTQIVSVDQDVRSPHIAWRSRRGVLLLTPLVVLSIGESILPNSAHPRSRIFLARLGSWARSR
ncbi:hypothetical protein [Leifsonia xyli]|uniref:hypothetical protein n=1 Tax=Leifsonia xyli TaxID=1575 RepID=UPI003D66685C